MHDLILRQDSAVEITIQTVLDSLDSPHSRRAYERHLREFIAWHQSTGQAALNKQLCNDTRQGCASQAYQRRRLTNDFQLSANLPQRHQTMGL